MSTIDSRPSNNSRGSEACHVVTRPIPPSHAAAGGGHSRAGATSLFAEARRDGAPRELSADRAA
jgi:hypothetical protein